MTLVLTTAGESHGPALVAIVSGLPAGLRLATAAGIGLLLTAVDTRRRTSTAALFMALLVIAEGIVFTLTRAGLATMAASLAGAALWRRWRHGPGSSPPAVQ